MIEIDNNDQYYIIFTDGTGLIINQYKSRGTLINKRILFNEVFSLRTSSNCNGAIYLSDINLIHEFDFHDTNSNAFDANFTINSGMALFGLDNNHCQLWTLVNDLSIEQLIFILELQKGKELNQSIEYDPQILESFHADQQVRIKNYFKLP